MIDVLEQKLDSFNAAQRKESLLSLCELAQKGDIKLPQPSTAVNLHCHTFFSYNSYGYSPTKFAWLARKNGLAVGGTVDFDVLDAVDEFLEACSIVSLKGCAGLETRVFLPEFADDEISSPGEPGITYHMGVGFTASSLKGKQKDFLLKLKQTAQQRNQELTKRVNQFLDPVKLDYKKDVLVLTPSGNATERHICLAYARKAQQIFKDEKKLLAFWSEKLSAANLKLNDIPESVELLNTIRAKTMKKGGIGYVAPDKGSFPLMEDVNKFTLASGAIPTLTWLSGFSSGEKKIEQLLDIATSIGTAAVNIIPDRNYTPGVKDQKLQNLCHVIELVEKRDLPLIVGTEMNSPGQKFVDSFETKELSPFVPLFLKGAHIVYAHTVLQKQACLGYTSDWAKENFKTTKEKNAFYEKVGKLLAPDKQNILTDIDINTNPEQILKRINNS